MDHGNMIFFFSHIILEEYCSIYSLAIKLLQQESQNA